MMGAAVYTSADPVVEFGQSVVTAARAWIGTPFHWQQSVRGRGCDCKGLVVGVARDMGRAEAASEFARMAAYRPGRVDSALLQRALGSLFDRVQSAIAGDILLLRVGGLPQHLAIVSAAADGAPARMIHCYGKGPSRVIEVPVGGHRDIVSTWRWRREAAHG